MPSFAAFINQADEVGLESLLIADGLGWGDEWYRMTGASSNFIHIAQQALAEYGELSSETIYKWTRDNLQSGKWSHTDGIVMEEYKYTPETLPDPVVGEGYYTFPVLQYSDGEGTVIYPREWAEQELHLRP